MEDRESQSSTGHLPTSILHPRPSSCFISFRPDKAVVDKYSEIYVPRLRRRIHYGRLPGCDHRRVAGIRVELFERRAANATDCSKLILDGNYEFRE